MILNRFLASLGLYTREPFRLILVNNGSADSLKGTLLVKDMVIIQMPKNTGWMGGVNAGLKWSLENSDSKYVCWMNDDVQILDHDYGWLTKMLNCFELDERIGAVGPTSNAIMGNQSVYYQGPPQGGFPPAIEATRLSGMCFLTKKEVVQKVGPLDESLPGGDDLDYSLRVRLAGYRLCICRRAFMIHNYAVTGRRVHGAYWDSREHVEAVNKAMIHKHGLKLSFYTSNDMLPGQGGFDFIAGEEKIVLEELKDELQDGVVLDLGCGGKKIHEKAIGVDIREPGTYGVGANANTASAAEVSCDVSDLKGFEDKSIDAILAKHLLEHILDPIKALKEWGRVLKDNGKLIIVCPDYRFCEAISVDPSHTHAFTPDSLTSLISTIGLFKVTKQRQVHPGYVFCLTIEKIPGPVFREGTQALALEVANVR